MSETFALKGFEDFKRQLEALPTRIARNVLRGGVNAAATVIRKEAVARAPQWTGEVAAGHPPPGALKKAIYQKQIAELSNSVQQTFYVSVRMGKGNRAAKGTSKIVKVDAFYARFVELGTSKMSARPFMRPAFEVKRDEALEAMRVYLAERIPKELERTTTI